MACSSTSVERRCHGKKKVVGTLRTVQQCIECVRGDHEESTRQVHQGTGTGKYQITFLQTGKVGYKYNEAKVCGDKEQAHKLQQASGRESRNRRSRINSLP